LGFRQTTICTASDDINSRIDGPAALNWIGAFGGVGGGWGRAAVAGHPDGAWSERLAGVVRAALPASGSKGAAEARGDCLSAVVTLQWRMPELTRRRSPDAPEECWHVYYCDVRVGTIAIRTGMPSRCEPCFSGASTGSEKSEILAGTSAAEGAEVSTKKV